MHPPAARNSRTAAENHSKPQRRRTRGHDNTITNSTITDSAGYNVKVAVDSSAYNNTGNSIRASSFARAGGASFAISSTGQGAVCSDTFDSTNVLNNKMALNPTVACQ